MVISITVIIMLGSNGSKEKYLNDWT